MNSAIGYSEGAEVPEDKTPRKMGDSHNPYEIIKKLLPIAERMLRICEYSDVPNIPEIEEYQKSINMGIKAIYDIDARNYGEWISVKDRLPNNCSDVLCLFRTLGNKYKQFVGNYTKGHELEFYEEDYDGEYDPIEDKNGTLYLKPGWYENEETPGGIYDEMWLKREVTHWMSLPGPPK